MRFRLFLVLAAGLASCEPATDDVPAPVASSLDFSRYVAVGDDYTAGVANGALTAQSQAYSFPNLLAQQLKRVGGGEFVQPLAAEGERFGAGLRLFNLTDRNLPLLEAVPSTFVAADTLNSGTACAELRYQFPRWGGAGTALPNNLGVPGLRVQDISKSGVGNAANRMAADYNPYLERLLPANDDRTYVQVVKAARPTFFTLWMGMSDIATYLRSGGTCGATVTAAQLQSKVFPLIDSLLATGASGVIGTLPVPNSGLAISRLTQTRLNQRLGRPDTFPIFIVENGVATRMLGKDAVLLPVAGRVGRNETATGQPAAAPLGSADNPLRDEDVLTEGELRLLGVAISNFNTALINTYNRKNAAVRTSVVGLDDFFFKINSNGVLIDGVLYTGDPVTGGFFGYDGISLTPRGNALVVNRIIEVLNKSTASAGFDTHIPGLDANNYPAMPLL